MSYSYTWLPRTNKLYKLYINYNYFETAQETGMRLGGGGRDEVEGGGGGLLLQRKGLKTTCPAF